MTRDHLADMQQVLRIESDAIAQTANRLDREQVSRVVELVANCKGKVVILGVGTSGVGGLIGLVERGEVRHHRTEDCGDDD